MIVSQEELDQIVYRYQSMVWRVALSVSRNEEDARDIFQDVFLQLVRSIAKIENEAHLKHWLIRATVNRGYTLLGSSWKKKTDSYDRLHDELGDALEPGEEEHYELSSESGYDPSTADTERGEKAMTALQKLKREYRTVIHLFYYEQLPVKTIAGILGINENAVKTRLSRAREMLRKEMSRHE